MRKSIFFSASLFFFCLSCRKDFIEKNSDKLNISVLNECYCKVKILKSSDSTQVLNDVFDCNYTNILRLNISTGTYILKAETGTKTKYFELIKPTTEINYTIEF